VFERFTDRARKSVVWAQEEARALNHPHIGTEHLLLGLIREGEGVGARALDASGLTTERARALVEQRVGRGTEPPRGHMPFTPRAKSVLEMALREALKLEHDYIGTEHVLLGLIREGEGVAAQILMSEIDGGLDHVRENVVEILAGALPSRGAQGERIETIRQVLAEREARGRSAFTTLGAASSEDIVKRLEAIEARLSTIEQLLRRRSDEEDAS
jgi:ATP-dependent Clp protease ATP-binding subunit ClpA